jgi:hypothetical protein
MASQIHINNTIENLTNISTILLFVLTLISVIIAYNEFNDNKKRKSKENAVNLAHYFQNKILPLIEYTHNAVKDTELQDKLKRYFPENEIKDFDKSELIKLSGNQNIIQDIEELILKIPIVNLTNASLSTCKAVKDITSNMKFYSKTIFLPENFEDPKKQALYNELIPQNVRHAIKHNTEIAIRNEFNKTINELLNTLEWFSMNFNQGIADEGAVYQSLHQLFLSTVYELYYFISRNNECNSEKYYVNIIDLFLKWRSRKEKSLQLETKLEQELDSKKKGSIINVGV